MKLFFLGFNLTKLILILLLLISILEYTDNLCFFILSNSFYELFYQNYTFFDRFRDRISIKFKGREYLFETVNYLLKIIFKQFIIILLKDYISINRNPVFGRIINLKRQLFSPLYLTRQLIQARGFILNTFGRFSRGIFIQAFENQIRI